MPVSILRPNATVSNNGTLVSAATAHGALSDDSDTSRLRLAPTQGATLDLGDFTLPAGSIVSTVTARVRVKANTGGVIAVFLEIGGETYTYYTWVTWSALTTISATVAAESFTEAEIDAARLLLGSPGGGTLEFIEAYVDVTYVTIPVVTVTDPTGTIVDSTAPLVEWTEVLDSAGGEQTRFEVKIFDDATYGAGGFSPDTSTPDTESDEVASAALVWQVEESLDNDTYRSYVRVAQTVNGELHWSAWDYEGFVVNTPRPADPTLLLTAEPDDGRIRIDVDQGAGGAVTTDLFYVESSPDGATWSALRTVVGDGLLTPASGEASAWDYEAPNGETVFYRVRAEHQFTAGRSASDWAQDSETWESTSAWLKHPTDPSLNLAVRFSAQPSHRRAARRGVHQPLGRSDPIVISDVRGPKEGEITFMVEEADLDAFEALLDTVALLLVQAGAGDKWPDRWVSFGDENASRYADKAWIEEGLRALPWIEVARPDGDLVTWS